MAFPEPVPFTVPLPRRRDPHRTRARGPLPASWYPGVCAAARSPISVDPDKAGSRRNAIHFRARWGRRSSRVISSPSPTSDQGECGKRKRQHPFISHSHPTLEGKRMPTLVRSGAGCCTFLHPAHLSVAADLRRAYPRKMCQQSIPRPVKTTEFTHWSRITRA
jgi:hypothetical protein